MKRDWYGIIEYPFQPFQMAERDQEEIEVAIAEDEKKEETYEDTPIYNPKNLPIGLDGKPIPYWLYKVYSFFFQRI